MDDVTTTTHTPDAAGGTQAANDASSATTPSPGTSKAASGGNTAPSPDLAREAYERLEKGSSPKDVNRDLYAADGKGAKGKGVTAAATSKEQPATPAEGQWAESIDKKDLAVLKRAKMDADVWAAIPPTNQAKILKGLRDTQAAQDRAFQQQRQQKPGKDAAAAAAQPQTALDSEDAETHRSLEELETEQLDAAAAAATRQPSDDDQATTNHDAPTRQQLSAEFFTAADRATLQQLGGDDLAEIFERGLTGAVRQQQQQNTQLLGVVEFLLEQHVDTGFNSALTDLVTQPGMDGLKREHADFTKNSAALKQKALLLHRAAGDARTYSFKEAVQDAAASLFKTNIQQTIQAQLGQRRQQSLKGAADRGDASRHIEQQVDPRERARQIYQQLAEGATPNQARLAVDGA
jgi:hypothetical protein